MRPLSELPHRFWPPALLPSGVQPRDKFSNQKIVKIKSAYGKVVSPVLRAAGFRCRGTKGERVGAWLWEGVWLLGGKYGGKAQIVVAAHPPGFPARNEYVVTAPYDYPACIFKRTVRFHDGERGDEFDLGFSSETDETVAVMAEAVAADGLAYLDRLQRARPRLLSITADSFDVEMPLAHAELGLCVTDSAFENAENAAIELLLLLVRVHREAGSPHAQALAERGLAAFEATERRGVVHHVARILFARLPAGGPLHASDAEKQAAWDAMRG